MNPTAEPHVDTLKLRLLQLHIHTQTHAHKHMRTHTYHLTLTRPFISSELLFFIYLYLVILY